MKFLPFEEIVLNSEMNVDELIKRLKTKVIDIGVAGVSISDQYKLFNGRISSKGFSIRRKIIYASPARTEIIGEIRPLDQGCKIHVRFELNAIGTVFNVFMMIFAAVSLLAVGIIIYNGGQLILTLIPVGLILISILLTFVPFNYDVKKAKEMLLQVTKGSISK